MLRLVELADQESLISSLITEVKDKVQDIEACNIASVAPQVVGSYNPPKTGVAYYFEGHGRPVRQNRKFSIDKEQTKDRCRKKYPAVTAKGCTHLFTWL